MVAEGLNYCKSGVSKIDGCSYKFEYIKQEELPDNYKKSANIRPKRFSEEERKKNQKEAIKKWLKKNWKCPNCGKITKNYCRSYHRKHCNM